ncbi:uncharacterized protein LOC6567610 [Drosophila grimshawi]|uniref:GH17942 n=1 Tax=Drosophila grimshawi TaxID=7222 RepID=B4JSK5_DROGR|nr:uncharacterized protein LOC6567610 [Drosophila grimshawi]EDV94745.1 GH17942 [Drosophila grimshawi]
MHPSDLGKKTGALVIEVLQVLGRPASLKEVSQRIANIYKVEGDRIRRVVEDVLAAGVHHGFFKCRNYHYSINATTIEHLRQDIDQYVNEMLSLDCQDADDLPQPSKLMLKLELLDDGSQAMMPMLLPRRPISGELFEPTPPGDAAVDTY